MVVNKSRRPVNANLKRPRSVYKGFPIPMFLFPDTIFGKAYMVDRVWFSIFGFSFGIAKLIPDDEWFNEDALDYISLYFDIEIAAFDDVGHLKPESYRLWKKGDRLSEHGYYEGMTFLSVVNRDKDYVGDLVWALRLIELGIYNPERGNKKSKTCSIGWSDKKKKYYGWSHRSIAGYKVGQIIEHKDLATKSPWVTHFLKQHPELDRSVPVGMEIKTIQDARKAAIAFADAVS